MEQKLHQDLYLGAVLRRMRHNRNETQGQVVIQLQLRGYSVTKRSYSYIENGRRSLRVSELISLKQIFRVSYEDLFLELEKEEEARQ